ncbi:hypothetical protein BD780_002291 [Clostridium tetanomorphum]|uniref:Uncharacterized protein n=1 Tax=Clostridium tetanomorphum TaxID=1553 RepID=A0A923IZ63_CLOTT|nr:hypothetical protein [Clostridium tetanomorphum]KAJ53356.1 hypothetical protein CTM_02659 [Clostridium tetanomorphum DSM 665]MBC2396657.1 hypothetical protein [Clostridium tetanomorphum]MBP1863988.1 hypothetical protein [Clostridium tetanomorphum]NRS85066.1 hypothetical protein [Clostridium tetanomorphum]NRZ98283.1 hypothetical protein [Clostridium tetanomorphum]
MGFTDKLNKYYAENYIKKYGDRLAQIQGNVVSVKIEEKTILWILHKITVTLLVRPDRSKNIVKCTYKKKKWFKKLDFISISQGNYVLVQGLKGKKGKENREQLEIMNIRNLTTKKDLIPIEGKEPKVQKVKTRYK